MPYHHILVAIDLSPRSLLVLKRASKIAHQNKATLDIVHVIEHSPIAYGGEFSLPVDVNLEQTIEAKVRELLIDLGDQFNIPPPNQHILEGSVKHSVIELGKKLTTDLIILGTHGHQGIGKLLGSRANAILHAANCDVLAIRSEK